MLLEDDEMDVKHVGLRERSVTGLQSLVGLSTWFHGVMVSTLDSESSDPSSNLGGTWF